MIRHAGGWYCDATPQGAWVALIKDSRIETDAGQVSLPQGQNLLYVRIAPDGLRFAGVGHHDDLCWQWNHMLQRWDSHGLAFGPRAVSYTADGALQVVRHAPAAPTLHDRDRQIHEYTELPGLTIGHGGDGPHGEDPAIALMDGQRFLIEEGQCRFIIVRESGRLSIAYVREDTRESVIRWMSRDEIRALPIADTSQQVPTIPTPQPELDPMSWPDISATLQRKRDELQLAELTADQCVALLDAVASEHPGFGLLRKDGGNHGRQPGTGIRCSVDWLLYQPTGVGKDVLGDAGDSVADETGPARVAWGEPEPADMSRFVAPSRATQPEPDPGDDEPDPGMTLEARVEAIERWIRRAL